MARSSAARARRPNSLIGRLSAACRLVSMAGALAAGAAAAEPPSITLATTTTTENSGLTGYLLPRFEAKTGIKVRVVVQGTGQVLRTAARGDVDVFLAHDPAAERAFVDRGDGVGRRDVMYNYFVIVGPKADPAGVAGVAGAARAFARIAGAKSPFVSRGDDSGTHRAERRIWRRAGIAVAALRRSDWYIEAGTGMGATLNVASGKSAYALTDQGTWAAFRNRGGLGTLLTGDGRLRNQYAVTLVNPKKHAHVEAKLAQRLVDWLTSKEGQAAIAAFTIDGRQVFFPNARPDKT